MQKLYKKYKVHGEDDLKKKNVFFCSKINFNVLFYELNVAWKYYLSNVIKITCDEIKCYKK